MTHEDAQAFFDAQLWIFAKTMPDNPHHYCLLKNCAEKKRFVEVAFFINENGVREWFRGRPYTQFYLGDYHYWTMDDPISATDLINRKKIPSIHHIDEDEHLC